MANALSIVTMEFAMPEIFAASPKARKRVLEFFGTSIGNENTRKAYMTACAAFFDFLADNDVTRSRMSSRSMRRRISRR
jgi:hypothetical protein